MQNNRIKHRTDDSKDSLAIVPILLEAQNGPEIVSIVFDVIDKLVRNEENYLSSRLLTMIAAPRVSSFSLELILMF